VSYGFHRRWPQVVTLILPKFLTSLPSGMQSLQFVSVDFVPPNLFNFAEWCPPWCLISIESECWFCATKSVWFFWATSALVSDIYRQWVFIWCHQICLILLSDNCFCVWSLQAVSVDFVSQNLFHFAEWHLLWSDLYSLWVLILCHQICLILLSNICFGVWSL